MPAASLPAPPNPASTEPTSAAPAPTRRRPIFARCAAVVAGVSLVVGLAGCSVGAQPPADATGGDGASTAPTESPTAEPSTPPADPVVVDAQPADGAKEFNPVKPVSVTASNGTLESVTLTPAEGDPVEGVKAADGMSWKTEAPLAFNSTYTLKWTAQNPEGDPVEGKQTFSTVSAANEADIIIYPGVHMSQVGVGQPLQFQFSEPVTNRAEMEKAITVTSSAGQQGKFHWYGPQLARYRAEGYWKPGSTLSVRANVLGMDFGNGMIGNGNFSRDIKVGEKKVLIADNATKRATAYINDKEVGSWPITLGNDEWRSTQGVKVIMEQYDQTEFNAGTIGLEPGDPHYYPPVVVHNASRITSSGEFIHQALDSAKPYLGVANVSHGCIGMPAEGAAWVYKNMTSGDIVQIKGTDYGPTAPTDGFGDWNIPWAEYGN